MFTVMISCVTFQTSSPSLTALLKGTGPCSQAAVSVPRPQVSLCNVCWDGSECSVDGVGAKKYVVILY